MAREIALEWDDREVRLVVAQCRGGNVRVEHALTAPLPEGEQATSPQAIGQALATLLEQSGQSRCEAIVVIGRASIELRRMKLPPAPPEDLPDMVRFQAAREFTSVGDDWPLDYELLSSAPEEPTWVLAAVLSPEMLQHARQVVQAAGLTMGHLLLRPFAAASLFETSALRGTGASPLLIDTAADESDLTALADDRVMFTRTVKLAHESEHSDAYGTALIKEIRRTLIAAQNQQVGYQVDQILLCDDASSARPLADQIHEELGLPVGVLDPFEVVDISQLEQRPPGPGRFASLMGALLEESREERHAIDFLDPKRRPPPPDRRRVQWLAGTATALLLFALVGGTWWQLWQLDVRAAELNRQIRSNEPLLQRYAEKQQQLKELEQFAEADIVWLEELRRISQAAPPPDDLIVTQFRATLQADQTGRIALEGVVSDAALLEDFENRLRDEAHRVSGVGGTYDQRGELPWRFNETITIDPTAAAIDSPGNAAGDNLTPSDSPSTGAAGT